MKCALCVDAPVLDFAGPELRGRPVRCQVRHRRFDTQTTRLPFHSRCIGADGRLRVYHNCNFGANRCCKSSPSQKHQRSLWGPASFIFQPCIFNSCSHSGKTGHFMKIIPGIHQHSFGQQGSQIFLCQSGGREEKAVRKWDILMISCATDSMKGNFGKIKQSRYAIIQMLWSRWFHTLKLYIQRRNKQPSILLAATHAIFFLCTTSSHSVVSFYHQRSTLLSTS